MVSMRKEAEDSYSGKLDRMGLGVSTSTTGPTPGGHQRSKEDGSDGMASGGRAKGYETAAANEATMEAKAPTKLRLDRKPFAHGGAVKKGKGTTVNVIIAPQGGGGAEPPMMPPPGPPPMPMPPPHPPGAGPMPPPGGGPGLPGAGGPPPMMRASGGVVPAVAGKVKKFLTPEIEALAKEGSEGVMKQTRANGGKVSMDAGAGGGKGRLEKIKEYGDNAKP